MNHFLGGFLQPISRHGREMLRQARASEIGGDGSGGDDGQDFAGGGTGLGGRGQANTNEEDVEDAVSSDEDDVGKSCFHHSLCVAVLLMVLWHSSRPGIDQRLLGCGIDKSRRGLRCLLIYGHTTSLDLQHEDDSMGPHDQIHGMETPVSVLKRLYPLFLIAYGFRVEKTKGRASVGFVG